MYIYMLYYFVIVVRCLTPTDKSVHSLAVKCNGICRFPCEIETLKRQISLKNIRMIA